MNYHIEYFWDRSLRLWTILVMDQEGNQVDDDYPTEYAPRKDDRDKLVNLLGFPVKNA